MMTTNKRSRVAACDGNGGQDAGACRLLSTHEVEELVGVPMRKGVLDADRTVPGTYCEWTREGSDSAYDNPAAGIDIEERTDARARREFEKDRRSGATETFDGLGDQAFFYRGTLLDVQAGTTVLALIVTGDEERRVSDAEARDLAVAAARIVVRRIGRR